jgi:hypothetical protein
MRMRTVAVLVIIVLVLAGVTAWALMPRASGPGAGPGFDQVLATLSPETLRAIEVTQPDAKVTRIEFDAGSRQWLLHAPDDARWPVVASRPRALAGLLAELGKGSREKTSEPASARVVRVEFNTPQAAHEIRVDTTALAGRTRVYTKDDAGQWWSAAADAQFAAIFTPESLRAWVESRALVDLGQTASQIRLECADGRITLARQGARWTISSPSLGNADAQAVTALLQQLGEFTRSPRAAANQRQDNPSVFFTEVTCDLPSATGSTPIVQTIRVLRDGVAPDAVEGEGFATLGESERAWGPAVVRIDRAKFDAISADPAKYVSRIATEVARADIAIIRVTRESGAMDATTRLSPLAATDAASARAVTISTSGAAWRITPVTSSGAGEPASRGVAATPEQEKWIGQLRDLLTSTRATSVSMGSAGGGEAKGELVLTLASPGGAPLDVVAVGVSSAKGAPRVVIRRGGVYLMYEVPQGAGLVEWLERQIPPEG